MQRRRRGHVRQSDIFSYVARRRLDVSSRTLDTIINTIEI
jgi:hypothetical protein